ncbi:MAG: hypothetical protein [Microvirus sp.]|nr:MAG: hypothetical protein [Microvirus sp.]
MIPIALLKADKRLKAQRAEPVRRTPVHNREPNDPVQISGSMLNCPAGEAIRLGLRTKQFKQLQLFEKP